VERSPRLVPTRIVTAGQNVAPQVAFRPVKEEETDSPNPHIAVPHIRKYTYIAVPHIHKYTYSSTSYT
jgi:hypothetical protein